MKLYNIIREVHYEFWPNIETAPHEKGAHTK